MSEQELIDKLDAKLEQDVKTQDLVDINKEDKIIAQLVADKIVRLNITVAYNSIIKLDNFYQLIEKGGYENWKIFKEKEKKQAEERSRKEIMLLDSTNKSNQSAISTNKISTRISLITAFIAALTLLVLVFQVICFNSKIDRLESDKKEIELENLKKTEENSTLIQSNLHKQKEIDSLKNELQKTLNPLDL